METIELEFFRVFGIEPTRRFFQCKNGIDYYEECEETCQQCSEAVYNTKYPTITAEIREQLLEILLSKNFDLFKNFKGEYILCDKDEMWIAGESVKDVVSKACIQLQPEIQEQVRQLFN